MISSRPIQGTRPFFKFFSCSNDFIIAKSVFLLLMIVNVCWIVLAACFLDSYWSVFGTFLHSSGICPFFPLAGGLYKLFANVGGKWQIQRQPLLVQYKQQCTIILHSWLAVMTKISSLPMKSDNNRNKDTFCTMKTLESISWDSPFKEKFANIVHNQL